jgi:hypothetical protein
MLSSPGSAVQNPLWIGLGHFGPTAFLAMPILDTPLGNGNERASEANGSLSETYWVSRVGVARNGLDANMAGVWICHSARLMTS